jgi:pectinesterase
MISRAEAGEAVPAGRTGPVRIVLIGDSTVCDFPASSELRGWGQVLPGYFKDSSVQIINRAVSGRSSKSFLLEGFWQKILQLDPAPDYVFIQFAGNDLIGKGPARETLPGEVPAQLPATGPGSDPKDWYRNNIRTYIEQSRSMGAVPVMITSMERPQFRGDVPARKNQPYAEAAMAVAKEMKVLFIDMESYSFDVYSKLGLQGCQFMHVFKDGKLDSHYNETGARIWAEFIAEQLHLQVPALKPLIALPACRTLDKTSPK